MAATDPLNILNSEQAAGVLRRLHAEADKQTPGLILHYLPKLPSVLLGRPLNFTLNDIEGYYADKFLALEPQQAAFCHSVARSLKAKTIVEFGTSFGISTIWLAAALRANGGGVVIGSELLESKAERARENVAAAGLSEYVEIRVGDARETLVDLPEGIDMFLNDGFPMLALDILKQVAPHMRGGAVVITDNVGTFKGNFRDYLAYVREPSNGFVSSAVPFKSGTEFSVKVTGRPDGAPPG